jgi:hypothetical protein
MDVPAAHVPAAHSIRITRLSGQDLPDPIGRAMLRETQALYTQWQQQGTYWLFPNKPGNTFSIKPELAPYWNDPFFRTLVADRVRFALTRYFSRKAQVADIPYTPNMLNTGFPVPRDFALVFYAENPLKPGESRKIKLKIKGKRYDALFERPGASREYLIIYDAQGLAAHALREYVPDHMKPGDTAFTLRASGKNEITLLTPFPVL